MDPKLALWIKLGAAGAVLVALTVLTAIGRLDAQTFIATVERVGLTLMGGAAVLGGAGAIGGALAGEGSGPLSSFSRAAKRESSTPDELRARGGL